MHNLQLCITLGLSQSMEDANGVHFSGVCEQSRVGTVELIDSDQRMVEMVRSVQRVLEKRQTVKRLDLNKQKMTAADDSNKIQVKWEN